MKRIFPFSCRNTSFKLFRLQQRDFGVRPGFKYRIFHSPAPETDSDATQSSSNTMEQETVSPNSDSNILIAYFTMPEDVDDN